MSFNYTRFNGILRIIGKFCWRKLPPQGISLFLFFFSSVFAFLSSVPLALGLLTSQLRPSVAFVGLEGFRGVGQPALARSQMRHSTSKGIRGIFTKSKTKYLSVS